MKLRRIALGYLFGGKKLARWLALWELQGEASRAVDKKLQPDESRFVPVDRLGDYARRG